MKSLKLKELKSVFNNFSKIKLAYHFGSNASGSASPLSDYDFAFYLDTKDKESVLPQTESTFRPLR